MPLGIPECSNLMARFQPARLDPTVTASHKHSSLFCRVARKSYRPELSTKWDRFRPLIFARYDRLPDIIRTSVQPRKQAFSYRCFIFRANAIKMSAPWRLFERHLFEFSFVRTVICPTMVVTMAFVLTACVLVTFAQATFGRNFITKQHMFEQLLF